MLRRLFRFFSVGTLLVLMALGFLLVISPFYIYSVFNQEFPVAQLEFSVQGDKQFLASISQDGFCSQQSYLIQGDQFQLDAGFAKWKGIGILLGFEPRYRLDRLSGRYKDIREQNESVQQAHDLSPDMLFDFFDEPGNAKNHWMVDNRFGSSVYQTIDPSLRYTVYATEDSLILRIEPVYTRNEGNLLIEINNGCSNESVQPMEFLLGFNDWLLARLP